MPASHLWERLTVLEQDALNVHVLRLLPPPGSLPVLPLGFVLVCDGSEDASRGLSPGLLFRLCLCVRLREPEVGLALRLLC
eukprot:764518-Hanusia_phi.AAC.1